MKLMVRPCFLVVDPEHSGSISTRKLVIESAKLNVITAYSGAEAIQTVQKFPAVDGVVSNSELRDMPVQDLVHRIKQLNPALPVIVVGPSQGQHCDEADFQIETFDPVPLLEMLHSLNPEKVSAIIQHEDELRDEE